LDLTEHLTSRTYDNHAVPTKIIKPPLKIGKVQSALSY